MMPVEVHQEERIADLLALETYLQTTIDVTLPHPNNWRMPQDASQYRFGDDDYVTITINGQVCYAGSRRAEAIDMIWYDARDRPSPPIIRISVRNIVHGFADTFAYIYHLMAELYYATAWAQTTFPRFPWL